MNYTREVIDMIGRNFVKRLRLLFGRSETISTRFEFDSAGQLVEHIVVETHDPPVVTVKRAETRGQTDSNEPHD